MLAKKAVKGLLCSALVGALVLVGAVAEAKGSSGGSRSSGSGRSSGYSNTGRSAPSSSPASGSKPQSPASGYGNSGQKSGAAKDSSDSTGNANSAPSKAPASNAPQSSIKQTPLQKQTGTALRKENAAKALADYKVEKGKFKQPDTSVSSSDATQSSVMGRLGTPSMTTYYSTRRDFYGGMHYAPPPYMYDSRPRFGMWDAMALWFILDHFREPRYSSMYYHHGDDPGMQEWRREADRLAQDNAELKTKLAGLDEQVKGMSTLPKDPSYVPDDMKTAVLAPDEAEKVLPASTAEEDAEAEKAAEVKPKKSHTLLYGALGLGLVGLGLMRYRARKRG